MKPPYTEESIPILADDSIPVSEKIDYLESWIIKAESEKVALKKKRDNIAFQDPQTPTKMDFVIYGDEGGLSAYDIKVRQKESKLRQLDRKIQNKENAISNYQVKLKKYKKIQSEQQKQIGDKIDQWLETNIPNSPNKGAYKEAFGFIRQQPAPKQCTYSHLLKIVRENLDPNISDESLRKKIPQFVNDLPL